MDKLLMLCAIQFTQTALLGMMDVGRWWSASGDIGSRLGDELGANLLDAAVDLLVSGTLPGKLADLGSLMLALVNGVQELPTALLAMQWALVLAWLAIERLRMRKKMIDWRVAFEESADTSGQ